jgi:hypothetical protein
MCERMADAKSIRLILLDCVEMELFNENVRMGFRVACERGSLQATKALAA